MTLQSDFAPLVSVIIPTYNRCQLVQEAIDSVLVQTHPHYELIVVDDGSTDGTGDVLQTRYAGKIIYIWQENQGESAARNYGISAARGEYIAFLDSDDLWLPEKLSRQVSVLENNPDVGAVFCQAWHIDGNGQRLDLQPLGFNSVPADFDLDTLLMRNRIPAGASTGMIRSSIFEKIGTFSQDIRYGEDWDLWLRISANSSIILIPEPLVSYRQHIKSQSYFTNAKRVDDILADRLIMLERCVTRSPEKIARQSYARAVANQYFTAGLANFLLQEPEKGKARLGKAVDVFPGLWKNKDDFSQQVAVFADSYSIDRNGDFSPDICLSFVDSLCAHLPDVLNQPDWIRLIQGKVRMEVGFRQYKNGERPAGLRQLWKGAQYAPQLINWAVLAVFAELFVGRGIINRLRRFRHKEARGVA